MSVDDCLTHLREAVRNDGSDCVFITLCPHADVSTVRKAAAEVQLFSLVDILQVNETGIIEPCDLYALLGARGREVTVGKLGLELPPDARWEDIRMEISTLDTCDLSNSNLLADKVRFSGVRNGVVFSRIAPVSVRDLHPKFHKGSTVTALWILMRDYARNNGRHSQAGTKSQQDIDNTNRRVLSEILRELVGLSGKPFRQSRPSETKFTIFFNNF